LQGGQGINREKRDRLKYRLKDRLKYRKKHVDKKDKMVDIKPTGYA
jgi:hypothetical protein